MSTASRGRAVHHTAKAVSDSPSVLVPGSEILLGVVVLGKYVVNRPSALGLDYRVSHVAVLATFLATHRFFPWYAVSYPDVAVWLVVVMYDLPSGRPRSLFVAGATLANPTLTDDTVRQVLRATPLDPGTEATFRETLRPLLGLASPVLVGCLVMLAACLLYRIDEGEFDVSLPEPRGG